MESADVISRVMHVCVCLFIFAERDPTPLATMKRFLAAEGGAEVDQLVEDLVDEVSTVIYVSGDSCCFTSVLTLSLRWIGMITTHPSSARSTAGWCVLLSRKKDIFYLTPARVTVISRAPCCRKVTFGKCPHSTRH